MIMNNKKAYNEESQWEQFEVWVKLKILLVMHHLLENNVANNFVFAILAILEQLQAIYFTIHPSYGTLWPSKYYNYILQCLQYFQVNSFIQETGEPLVVTLLYVTFAVLALWSIVWVYLCIVLEKKQQSGFLVTILKYYSFLSQVLFQVLSLPMYDVLLSVVWCSSSFPQNQGFECYQGIHILHLVVATACLVTLTTYQIIFTYYLVDYNPVTKGPYVGVQASSMTLNSFMKFWNPFGIIFNLYGGFTQEYIPFLGCIWMYNLILRFSKPPQYNLTIYWVNIVIETIVFWFNLNSIFATFLTIGGIDDIGLCFTFVGLPFFIFAVVHFLSAKNREVFNKGLKNMMNDELIDFYLYALNQAVERRNDSQVERIRLFGLLKDHYSECHQKGQCCCQELINQNHGEDETPETRANWYKWKRVILEQLIEEEFDKCSRIHLSYAYLANDKLNNPQKALYELMIAEDSKPDLCEEFSIYRYRTQLEAQMLALDQSDLQSQTLDVSKIVYYQNQYDLLSSSIEKSVELHLDFWREIQEDNPSIIKLQNIGSRILSSVVQCRKLYEELNSINPNSQKCQDIYSFFLLEVANNEEEGSKIRERGEHFKKIYSQTSQAMSKISQNTFGYNQSEQNYCVISVSGNYNTLGTVVNCSNEIVEMLEFYQSDLIGQNINRIMPKVIQEAHDFMMKRYLETSQSKLLGVERLTFPQSKSGYLVPAKLTIKVLPNLTKGIQIVGFLKSIECGLDEHFLIYDPNTQAVHGITEGFYTAFGVSADIIFGADQNQEFSLDLILKDFIDLIANKSELVDQQLKGVDQGVETVIDTTQLPMIFMQPYEAQNDLKRKDDEMKLSFNESLLQKLFRRAKVKVNVLEEQNIGETVLHTLHIKELVDNEQELIASRLMTQSLVKKKAGKDQMKTSSRQVIKEEAKESKDDEKSSSDQNLKESHDDSLAERRNLKDFKSIITQKQTPRRINHLNYLAYLLILSLIALSIGKLIVSVQQGSYLNEGIRAISDSYQRHSLMADVNLYCRFLDLLGRGIFQPKNVSQWENGFRTNLSVMIENLQACQFNIIQDGIAMTARTSANENRTYPVEFLLQSNESKIYNNLFNDAIFQFITSASTVSKSSLESFRVYDTVADTQKSFYFVVQNGLYVLREGSEMIADEFYNFYVVQDTFQTASTIILSVAIVFITIIVFWFTPNIFAIKTEMQQLISIYGHIPSDDIKDIILQGDQYMKDFIEKFTDKQEDAEDEEVNDQTDHSKSRSKTTNKFADADNIPEEVNDDLNDDDSDDQIQKNKALHDKHKHFLIQNKDKSQKIMESQNVNKLAVFFWYFVGAAVLIIEYVVMYILETQFTNGIQTSLQHMHYSVKRTSVLKYDVLFMTEELIKYPIMYKGTNLAKEYYSRVFNNEELYFNSISFSYPSDLDSYFALFQQLNYFDLCKSIDWIKYPELNYEQFIFVPYDEGAIVPSKIPSVSKLRKECNQDVGGLLQKGLRMAFYLINSNAAQMTDNQQNFNMSGNKSNLEASKIINSDNYWQMQRMMKFTIPTVIELNDYLKDKLQTYVSNQQNIQIYNFVAFLGFIFVVFLLIWRPYINQIQENIWKTKAMLQFIPLTMVEKVPALADAIARDVLQNDHNQRERD